MDAILMSMPALIYVLAVSGAVHITNYYRQAVIHHGFEGAVERGIAPRVEAGVLVLDHDRHRPGVACTPARSFRSRSSATSRPSACSRC